MTNGFQQGRRLFSSASYVASPSELVRPCRCPQNAGERSELANLRRTMEQTTDAAKSRDRENAQVSGSLSGIP